MDYPRKYIAALKSLHTVFSKSATDWMLVSGASVFYYNNPQRELTDLDIIVRKESLAKIESTLSGLPEIDGLSKVRFVNKFGVVRPLTPYLKMFVRGVEVHAANKWIYETSTEKIIRIPFNREAFKKANQVGIDGFKIKVARPELIFVCKSITRRNFRAGKRKVPKDLNDCELLVKGVRNFNFNYLKKLYQGLGLGDLYSSIALTIRQKYNSKL